MPVSQALYAILVRSFVEGIRMILLTAALALELTAGRVAADLQAASIEGLTFHESPKKLFVPLREATKALDLPIGLAADGRLQVAGLKLAQKGPKLPSGERLIPVAGLRLWGATVVWDEANARALVSRKGKEFYVRRGQKRVIIEKSNQRLIALQGSRTVMRTRVSTGREGYRTPNGNFAAGRKLRFNRSSLYNDAPMPYSVQVKGDIFVHGSPVVPSRAASHGCIRLPLNGPAEFFYEWVDPGTPIRVTGAWRRR